MLPCGGGQARISQHGPVAACGGDGGEKRRIRLAHGHSTLRRRAPLDPADRSRIGGASRSRHHLFSCSVDRRRERLHASALRPRGRSRDPVGRLPQARMPRIVDNLSPGPRPPPALRSTLSSASRADFCVGYFNLRGWRHLAPVVDGWGADAGPRPPQASVDRPASEGTSDAIDWAAPRVRGHALATSDAGRDAGGPRGFNDAPSWPGVKHAAADRLRAGNDRTTSRPLRPPRSSRRGTCRDAVYAACNTRARRPSTRPSRPCAAPVPALSTVMPARATRVPAA